jgi:hypothetical protein
VGAYIDYETKVVHGRLRDVDSMRWIGLHVTVGVFGLATPAQNVVPSPFLHEPLFLLFVLPGSVVRVSRRSIWPIEHKRGIGIDRIRYGRQKRGLAVG